MKGPLEYERPFFVFDAGRGQLSMMTGSAV
jgi:hypothetical protein